MKVLTVNFSDSEGGAARAAYRLHKALSNIGLDSRMLVMNKNLDDNSIIGPKNRFQKLIAKFKSILNPVPLRKYDLKAPFSTSFAPSLNIVEKINAEKADIVHLHWIHAGMLQIEDIPKIKAHIVWSMHDMWLFSGGCHYTDTCTSYLQSCGRCPVLTSSNPNDISNIQFLRKKNAYDSLTNLTVIGLSQWLQNTAQHSPLLKDFRIINLPNPIDIERFKPSNKQTAKTNLNLPLDKKLLLFGAMSSTSDLRKGFEQLRLSLENIKSDNVELVIFGNNNASEQNTFGFKTHYLGLISDDDVLNNLYNAADVMVVPSLQENLSNAIMESLSCGTPVVAFNIGGNMDMIEHKHNGYLANVSNDKDLANGIDWILSHQDHKELSQNAREKVVENFESRKVATRYLQLYQNILSN